MPSTPLSVPPRAHNAGPSAADSLYEVLNCSVDGRPALTDSDCPITVEHGTPMSWSLSETAAAVDRFPRRERKNALRRMAGTSRSTQWS